MRFVSGGWKTFMRYASFAIIVAGIFVAVFLWRGMYRTPADGYKALKQVPTPLLQMLARAGNITEADFLLKVTDRLSTFEYHPLSNMPKTDFTPLAQKAFRAADIDSNGRLSLEERHIASRVLNVAKAKQAGCILPPAGEAKIIVISTIGGASWSDVALIKKAVETNVVNLHIESGKQPLYIIARSFKPTIWHMTGAVNRVVQFVTGGINAGVTGIPREKTTFANAASTYCLAGHYEVTVSKEFRITNEKPPLFAPDVEDFLERGADVDFSSFFPHTLKINSSSVTEVSATSISQNTPEGFDADIWKTALAYKNGGVIHFENEAVVADVPVERYEVLPSWAGLAQLAGQGVLQKQRPADGAKRVLMFNGYNFTSVRISEEDSLPDNKNGKRIIIDEWQFRILKEPPLGYPPEVSFSAFSARFILPKDVVLSGFPMSAAICLRLEEGAQAPPDVNICVPLKKAAP